MSLALEFISEILFIKVGVNSLRTLTIVLGATSDPQIGGTRAVVSNFRAVK